MLLLLGHCLPLLLLTSTRCPNISLIGRLFVLQFLFDEPQFWVLLPQVPGQWATLSKPDHQFSNGGHLFYKFAKHGNTSEIGCRSAGDVLKSVNVEDVWGKCVKNEDGKNAEDENVIPHQDYFLTLLLCAARCRPPHPHHVMMMMMLLFQTHIHTDQYTEADTRCTALCATSRSMHNFPLCCPTEAWSPLALLIYLCFISDWHTLLRAHRLPHL